MTEAQKMRKRANEARREYRSLLADMDATPEAIKAATDKLADLETRAEGLEATEATANGPDKFTGEDAEAREFRELEGRVDRADYVTAALDDAMVSGAAAEFNQGLGMGRRDFPLQMLAPREIRTTTDVDAQADQGTWLDRLFGDSVASFLGIQMPAVSPGVKAYPVTASGGSGAQRGRSEATAAAAWTFSVLELKPTRHSIRAVFSVEDSDRLPGAEDALLRDLQRGLQDSLDLAILTGDDGANEATADITGLDTAAGVAEQELTQANKTAAASVLGAFVNLVDGKAAAMLSDLRAVLSIGAYRAWASTIASNAENDTLIRFLTESGLPQMRVREGISTTTVAGQFGAFVSRQRGISGAGIAPVWANARLVRDIFTKASEGEVVLTLQHRWAFGLARADNFARVKFAA